MLLALLATTTLTGCRETEPGPDSEGDPLRLLDQDGDGYTADVDCEDGIPWVHPGAEELLDCFDNDCDPATGEDPEPGVATFVDAAGQRTELSASELFGGYAAQEGTLLLCGGRWTLSLEVEGPLAVYGDGPATTTLEAAGTGSPLRCVGASLRLEGLTVTGGSTASSGGALYLESCPASLRSVDFRDNLAEVSGGAVYALYSPLVVEDAVFADNRAAYGGALYAKLASLSVSDAAFTDNLASEKGGALFFTGQPNTELSLDGLLISGNEAWEGGGLHSTEGRVRGRELRLVGNTAHGGGGGWHGSGSSMMDLDGVDFRDNQAGEAAGFYAGAPITLVNGVFDHNLALGSGGGLVADSGLGLGLVRFTDNQAQSGAGILVLSGEAVTVKSGSFKDNDRDDLFHVPQLQAYTWGEGVDFRCDVSGCE